MCLNVDGDGWRVEWAAEMHGKYTDNLALTPDQAREYGDDLVWTLRINGETLQGWGLDPDEPFVWKIDNGEVLTNQITRTELIEVANSGREDAFYASHLLEHRDEIRRLRRERGDSF